MLELDIMSKRGGGSMVEEKEETVERGRWCLAAPCLRLGFFFFLESKRVKYIVVVQSKQATCFRSNGQNFN